MADISFGERVRRARIQNAMTQGELGKKLGVAQPTIHTWEKDKVTPTGDQKAKLKKLLGNFWSGSNTSNAKQEGQIESNAVGSWLARSRIEKKFSVPELAERAGVSAASIYNIEQGRISNPRQQTISKLEQILKAEIPREAKEEAREEATVQGIGELVGFDPHNEDDRPSSPGIYVFYDISERPIYVGQAGDMKRRIRDHTDKFWFRSPIVETGAYIVVKEGDLRVKIETLLIRFLKSNAVINKQNVER
jgi:transcriptional regulator with XRE-family HTH domain